MRLAVYPSSTDIGGSQINAIELADRMARRGHHVVVFGPPGGVLVERIRALGMPFVPAPARPKVRPSPAVTRALLAVVDRHSIDVVHGYEWPPILEAYVGPFLARGVVPVGTVMSMGVAPFIPTDAHLVVGTAQIAESERVRRQHVHLIEPPVDVDLNSPRPASSVLRDSVGATTEDFLVVVVSRLANELKREGLLEAIGAVGELAARRLVHLVIVGDGPARTELEAAADSVNRNGREVVTLVGEVQDPRDWYATADVVIGMGSSALRAMAFGKPLVVQGERGFWRTLTPESLATFLHQGWYGVGDGADGTQALVGMLEELAADPRYRRGLGDYALSVVKQRFSLDAAADRQEQIYHDALENPPSRVAALRRLPRPAAQVLSYEARRRWMRIRGRGGGDDFNALSAQSLAQSPARSATQSTVARSQP